MKSTIKPFLANFEDIIPNTKPTPISYDRTNMLNIYKGMPAILSQLSEAKVITTRMTCVIRETTDDK